MPAKPAGDLGNRWNKVSSSLLISALLVSQQGASLSVLAADVVENAGAGASIRIGAPALSRTTLPQNLPSLAVGNGVDVAVPTGIETGAAAAEVRQLPGTAQVVPILPQAQAVNGQPQTLVPVSAQESIEPLIAAETPEAQAKISASSTGREAVVSQAQNVAAELETGKKTGGVGAFLARFFDRKKTGAKADVSVPVAAAEPKISGGERLAPSAKETKTSSEAPVPAPAKAGRKFIEFNVQYLKDIKKLFAESATKPNKQDFIYLATKTFGINLAIRIAFAVKGVHAGQLPLMRAVLSTGWYQIQDALFTIFGQTYMKFLGKMTGMFRIGKAQLGDVVFTYFQLVAFEFMNRLVLGPIGENPLVYSSKGIGLLFLNNLQGLISGGLINPVINKLYRAGIINEKVKNHLYQLASLTMHLGLLATFGYQHLFTIITTALMVLSWAAYIGLSFFAKDKRPEAKL